MPTQSGLMMADRPRPRRRWDQATTGSYPHIELLAINWPASTKSLSWIQCVSRMRYSPAGAGAIAAEIVVADRVAKEWDAAVVRTWLESRVVAARSDQVTAERGGRDRQDDCDQATAEEMVCSLMAKGNAVEARESFTAELRSLLDRDDYIWRGVYDDTRFDRHVRSFIRKLLKMTKTNDGFHNLTHYQ